MNGYEWRIEHRRNRLKIFLIFLITLTLSGLFIGLGWVSQDKSENATISVNGEWVPTERSSIHESNFACPGSGELVGNVWEDSGNKWKARTDYSSSDRWVRLEADFKDEQHAKSAAEKFIRQYKVCDKH